MLPKFSLISNVFSSGLPLSQLVSMILCISIGVQILDVVVWFSQIRCKLNSLPIYLMKVRNIFNPVI